MGGHEFASIRYFVVVLGMVCQLTGVKPNRCPRPSTGGACVITCTDDANCTGSQKCCFNGCGRVCMRPVIDGTSLFLEPDFVSSWHTLTAQAGEATTLVNFTHGLGETPLLVDVQVKVDTGDNAGFIFPGSGCRIRDDDQSEAYGGIVYLYNDVYIEVSSPTQGNGNLGRCIYTGIEPYWEGAYHTDSYTAQVRARAWRASSLPTPDFVETAIPISAESTTGSYVEKSHNLGEIPALVISRVKFPDDDAKRPNYYSDSIGATGAVFDSSLQYEQNGFVVHGFSDSNIRVWAPTPAGDSLFMGGDGWNFIKVEIEDGELELYSWLTSTLNPVETAALAMGPGSTDFTSNYTVEINDTFTRAWAEAGDGPNAGYRFVGNGNLAYDTEDVGPGCSYGGLVYAYAGEGIRFWRPGPGLNDSNGFLICIADIMGDGNNVQASSAGQAVYNVWPLDEDDCSPDPCVNGGCTNYDWGYNCTCDEGYTGTNCESDINECTDETDNCDVNAACANTVGSFTCACNTGYSGNGTSCSDINECTDETDNCDVNAACANTMGSYTCDCNTGYSGSGDTCSDDNECTDETDNCDVNAACANTVGSYTCACNSGFSGNGTSCSDNDECTDETDDCDVNAACTNTAGSFTCACKTGFSGNGTSCSDTNECTDNTDNCHVNAACTNTDGSYTCACDSSRGFFGDGVTCSHAVCNPDNSINVYDLPVDYYYYAMQGTTQCTTTDINSTAVTITGCSKNSTILLTYGTYSGMESKQIHGGKNMLAMTITCYEVPMDGNLHTINNSFAANLNVDEERMVDPTYVVTSSLNTSSTTVGSPVAWTISFPAEYILEVTECRAYPGTDGSSSGDIGLITSGGCYSNSELISNFTDNMDGTATAIILAFKFYSSDDVFLTCNLRICPAGSTSCDTGCSREKRSDMQVRHSRETYGDSYSATVYDVLTVWDPYSSATWPGADFKVLAMLTFTVVFNMLM